ncbi:MAG: hypothetical protein AB1540_16605 [Bdellovibrionota bacterium]
MLIVISLFLALISGMARAHELDGLPDLMDALNDEVLLKEFNDPENYPAYLYKPRDSLRHQVGKYRPDRHVDSEHVRCRHLAIHEDRSEQPISWRSRNTAASNVFYHAHRAIVYFESLARKSGQAIVPPARPVVVRLDTTVKWAMWIKFSNLPQYNNAFTYPDIDPKKWGTQNEQIEIWFAKPNREYRPWYFTWRWVPGFKNTFLGTERFPFDGARVPTVIYHEWAHVMTKSFLGIHRTAPLGEGYSDYFAAAIANEPIVGNVAEFAPFGYRRRFRDFVGPAVESDCKKPGLFVPSLLWSLRVRFGALRGDMIVWRSLSFLNPQSGVEDLPVALEQAAAEVVSGEELTGLKKRLGVLLKSKVCE